MAVTDIRVTELAEKWWLPLEFAHNKKKLRNPTDKEYFSRAAKLKVWVSNLILSTDNVFAKLVQIRQLRLSSPIA